jgi:ferredoxin
MKVQIDAERRQGHGHYNVPPGRERAVRRAAVSCPEPAITPLEETRRG